MKARTLKVPDPEPLQSWTFPRLDGGLDLEEPEYRMAANRSPEMKNLWWQDGVLQCRDGQLPVWQPQEPSQGFAACTEPFQNRIFFHAGSRLYRMDPESLDVSPEVLAEDVPENPGAFFPWDGHLYYKNHGGFYRMDAQVQEAQKVEELAYVPRVLCRADPEGPESGEKEEPRNLLTPFYRVEYLAKEGVSRYLLPAGAVGVRKITVDGSVLSAENYTVSEGSAVFRDAPAAGSAVELVVQGEKDESQTVLTCRHATVFGGGRELCILLTGGTRPNEVYWNGSSGTAMDPGYWPEDQRLTVGEASEEATGFGRQYGDLLLTKKRSLWRLDMASAAGNGRKYPTLSAALLSRQVGCDLPCTAALVENNLVFCSRESGVFQVNSASAAYETNIRCLSRRVHGDASRGLLRDLRQASAVTAFDDGGRYWLCADDRVYLWDYSISTPSDPSWFYLEGVAAVAFFRDGSGRIWHLDRQGQLTRFARTFSDYGRAIEKVYRFPALDFGTCDRLKDVDSVLLNLRADTDADVVLHYTADGVSRQDPTPIRCRPWRFAPRNLRYRCLRIVSFACTARRRPGIRRTRFFAMTLKNSTPQTDLAIVSAQVFYRLAGKQR